MPTLLSQPGPMVRQVSGNDLSGQPILSVLAKRSYRWSGRDWVPEPEPAELVEEPKFDDEKGLLVADTDFFPLKPFTDVIVKGFAYGRGKSTVEAGFWIDGRGKSLRVSGDRGASLSSSGKPVFSEPKPFEKIPLTYEFAYGGRDKVAEKKAGWPGPGMFGGLIPEGDATPETASPFRYPRNPAGRGYLVEASREGIEQMALPNLEDPKDLFAPDRIAAGDLAWWPWQPLPAAMDWVSHGWFPRIGYFGFVPAFRKKARPWPEVERGFATADITDPLVQSTEKAFRFTCGASLGLQYTTLRGGETMHARNLSPREPEEKWMLPRAPKILTDGRKGRFNPTEPVLHTVVLEPDAPKLMLVWRGAAKALRTYLPDELKKMPFGVEW